MDKKFEHALDWLRNISEVEDSLRSHESQGFELVSMIVDPSTEFIVVAYKKQIT